uniref:Protamine S4 n=1 Tax=Scyliorhinus canicula TaxID=7830 RepID=PRTS4_SCYCA|nr:RecName: Full=Protamine S4 [Scyliorhinus canicula]prf//1012206A scylliorhinine S4 [Scyliorhinus canicula]
GCKKRKARKRPKCKKARKRPKCKRRKVAKKKC